MTDVTKSATAKDRQVVQIEVLKRPRFTREELNRLAQDVKGLKEKLQMTRSNMVAAEKDTHQMNFLEVVQLSQLLDLLYEEFFNQPDSFSQLSRLADEVNHLRRHIESLEEECSLAEEEASGYDEDILRLKRRHEIEKEQLTEERNAAVDKNLSWAKVVAELNVQFSDQSNKTSRRILQLEEENKDLHGEIDRLSRHLKITAEPRPCEETIEMFQSDRESE